MNCSAGIVYSNTWLAQTSDIGSSASPFVILTVATTGLYRINYGVNAASPSSVSITVKLNGVSIVSNANNDLVIPYVLALPVGAVLAIFTGAGGTTYDAFVRVEQL